MSNEKSKKMRKGLRMEKKEKVWEYISDKKKKEKCEKQSHR